VLKIAALVLATAAGVMPAAAPASSSSRTVPTSRTVPKSTTVSSSTAASSPNLASNAAWWERVTVTISGDGKAQSCLYQSSLKPGGEEKCDAGMNDTATSEASSASSKGELTRITFERRFTPGASPQTSALETGDTLLGGQVMALGIDGRGSVKTCKIVAVSGEMRPDYGCSEASAERFDASVRGPRTVERDGYMSIFVYGHSEHMV
jgi:hypothetical protein